VDTTVGFPGTVWRRQPDNDAREGRGDFLADSGRRGAILGGRGKRLAGRRERCVSVNGAGPRRVLVVDDDPDILDALSEILEVEGYDVRRARNGREALQRISEGRPDLILLDLMMPVMDGWEFARTLGPVARPPIVVLSADRNVSQKANEIGAVGWLAKPFELTELLALVRRVAPADGA
jgi:two-component system chemotaxis response regulator CheY